MLFPFFFTYSFLDGILVGRLALRSGQRIAMQNMHFGEQSFENLFIFTSGRGNLGFSPDLKLGLVFPWPVKRVRSHRL